MSPELWAIIIMNACSILVSIGMTLQQQRETGRRLGLVEMNKADASVVQLHITRLDNVDTRQDRDITSVRHDVRNLLQRKETLPGD